MVVSDFSSDLELFCHVIQSQAALACASCARSFGSGNRCPGVLWSGVLVLLLPSFSSLSSMARKLINFQSCTILLVALLGKYQGFGLKISFKKAIGPSSYSSITISSRVLLLIFMEFLSSSFLAEVSFKKNFHRRGLGGFLFSITVYEANKLPGVIHLPIKTKPHITELLLMKTVTTLKNYGKFCVLPYTVSLTRFFHQIVHKKIG